MHFILNIFIPYWNSPDKHNPLYLLTLHTHFKYVSIAVKTPQEQEEL